MDIIPTESDSEQEEAEEDELDPDAIYCSEDQGKVNRNQIFSFFFLIVKLQTLIVTMIWNRI